MVFQLQPAPATRSFNKNRSSPPRTPQKHSQIAKPSTLDGSTSYSQGEAAESDRSESKTSRFQEHFSWGTLPGTASLGKPGVPAFAPVNQMPKRKNSKSIHRENLQLPSLVKDGASGSETEVDLEVEPVFKIKEEDGNHLSLPSTRPLHSELEYESEDDVTPGSTPVPYGSTVPTSIRGRIQSYSSIQADGESLRGLDDNSQLRSKEEAEKAMLNARLSASAGSVASSRRDRETRSWTRQSFTSATKSPTSNRLSSMRRRSSVKSPTSAEIQVLSFGDQDEESQELQFTTPRYDRPTSNFLNLPSPSSNGSRRHTSLLLPPFSPISPRRAAAQHSPLTLAPPTAQDQHLSIGTAPLSATLLALGVSREAHHYIRGNESSPSDDEEEDGPNPRWSTPFWARRSQISDQQAAAEENKRAIRNGLGLPRTTQPAQVPTSPNGGLLELSSIAPIESQQSQKPPTPKFLEVPPPTRQRGAIESTVRAGRLAASRFSTSLASFISGGNGSTTGSQRGVGQGWRGALPYNKRASSQAPLLLQSQDPSIKGKSDGWGGSRASWFPSSLLGPLVSPSPNLNVKSSPELKELHLSSSPAPVSAKYSSTQRSRPGLKVHFAPIQQARQSEERGEAEWIDEDETPDLFDSSPRRMNNQYANSHGGSAFASSSSRPKGSFAVSNPFRRRSSAGSIRSPTSPMKFVPPPPTTFNHGFPIGFQSSNHNVSKSNRSRSRRTSLANSLEENWDDGTSVTYRNGSAEGRPFNTAQQLKNQRKKTAFRRMGLILAVLIFVAMSINVIVLDFKLLPNETSNSNEHQSSISQSPNLPAISNTPVSYTDPAQAALSSTVSASSTEISDSMAQASTLSSASASPTPTATAISNSEDSSPALSSPVSAAVQQSGPEGKRLASGKAFDRQAYRFFGARVE